MSKPKSAFHHALDGLRNETRRRQQERGNLAPVDVDHASIGAEIEHALLHDPGVPGLGAEERARAGGDLAGTVMGSRPPVSENWSASVRIQSSPNLGTTRLLPKP